MLNEVMKSRSGGDFKLSCGAEYGTPGTFFMGDSGGEIQGLKVPLLGREYQRFQGLLGAGLSGSYFKLRKDRSGLWGRSSAYVSRGFLAP